MAFIDADAHTVARSVVMLKNPGEPQIPLGLARSGRDAPLHSRHSSHPPRTLPPKRQDPILYSPFVLPKSQAAFDEGATFLACDAGPKHAKDAPEQ